MVLTNSFYCQQIQRCINMKPCACVQYIRHWLAYHYRVTHAQVMPDTEILTVTLLHKHISRYQKFWLHCYTSTFPDIKDTGCYTVTQAHSQIPNIQAVTPLHCYTSIPLNSKILAVTLLHKHNPKQILAGMLLCCYTVIRTHSQIQAVPKMLAVTLLHCCTSRHQNTGFYTVT